MLRGLASGVIASVLAAATPAPAPPPGAYLAPADYGGVALAGYTARDAAPLYTEQIAPACSRAAAVDAAIGAAPAAGNGVLLGTPDGRVVVSETIRMFKDTKAARRFAATARSSPGCLVYAGRDSFHRVFAQYPQLPPLPALSPEITRSGARASATFQGTTDAAPLAGTTALLAWDRYVAETSIRVAAPRPGEVEALAHAVLAQADYGARAATGPGSRPELARAADAVAEQFLAATAVAPYGLVPAARGGVPANPASCTALTDAFVESGAGAAVRGFAGSDGTTGVGVTPELLVFAAEGPAARWFELHDDLAPCLTELYARGLPAGSTVDVRRTPRRGFATSDGLEHVAYRATITGPDGSVLGATAVEVLRDGVRAGALWARAAASDALRTQVAPVTRALQNALTRG